MIRLYILIIFFIMSYFIIDKGDITMFNNNFGCCQKNNMCCQTVSEQCCPEDPVYEMPVEKCIKKDYIHEVVHV